MADGEQHFLFQCEGLGHPFIQTDFFFFFFYKGKM